MSSLMNRIELGTVLDIELNENTDTSDLMVILAYGSKDTHYKFDDNGNLKWLNGNKPKTIGDLMGGDENILNDIELRTVLGVDALDPTADQVMVSIAYGTKNVHYKIENGKLSFVEKDLERAAIKLTRSLIKKDSSFVTIIYGEGVTEQDAEAMVEALKEKISPDIDVSIVKGDQPVYYYMIAVE